MKTLVLRICSKAFVYVGLTLCVLLQAPCIAATGEIKGPTREYLIGFARYVIERGYVAVLTTRVDHDELEIYYKAIAGDKDVGSTVDFRCAIPAWLFEAKLRKANYGIEETRARVYNKTFSLSSAGVLRSNVAEKGWQLLRVSAREIYDTKPVASPRILSPEIKTALLTRVLGRTVTTGDLKSYRISHLMPFENRLWIFDKLTERLFDVTSDGDLDDLEFIKRHPLTRVRIYIISETDLIQGTLLRKSPQENTIVAYGFWACFAAGKAGWFEPAR